MKTKKKNLKFISEDGKKKLISHSVAFAWKCTHFIEKILFFLLDFVWGYYFVKSIICRLIDVFVHKIRNDRIPFYKCGYIKYSSLYVSSSSVPIIHNNFISWKDTPLTIKIYIIFISYLYWNILLLFVLCVYPFAYDGEL